MSVGGVMGNANSQFNGHGHNFGGVGVGMGMGIAGGMGRMDSRLSIAETEKMLCKYRDYGQQVLDLLEYLDFNVLALRRIVRKHDRCFQSKMTSVYFDARLDRGCGSASSSSSSGGGGGGGAGTGGSKGKCTALVQLYHQEGLRAIIATLRRGFEELYLAKQSLQVGPLLMYISVYVLICRRIYIFIYTLNVPSAISVYP